MLSGDDICPICLCEGCTIGEGADGNGSLTLDQAIAILETIRCQHGGNLPIRFHHFFVASPNGTRVETEGVLLPGEACSSCGRVLP
jgi:hypothetical protein